PAAARGFQSGPRQPGRFVFKKDRKRIRTADRSPARRDAQGQSRRAHAARSARASLPAEEAVKLEGLRVLDLTLFLPGPYLTLALADHGAEVIKLEPPGEGDPTRHLGLSDGESTVYFRNLNRGKKSVVMDLKKPEEREALLKLCESADVFVESFRPGVVERLGVSYEQVSARNPRIVYCSISAFGQQGPLRDRPAHDLAVESLSGVISLNLGQDGKPAIPALPLADLVCALQGLSGILMRS